MPPHDLLSIVTSKHCGRTLSGVAAGRRSESRSPTCAVRRTRVSALGFRKSCLRRLCRPPASVTSQWAKRSAAGPAATRSHRDGAADYEAMATRARICCRPGSAAWSCGAVARLFSCAPSANRWIVIAVSWWRAASPSATSPSPTSSMTAQSRDAYRRNRTAAAGARREGCSTSLRLVHVWTARPTLRQRIAAGRVPSRFGGKLPHPETLRSVYDACACSLDRPLIS